MTRHALRNDRLALMMSREEDLRMEQVSHISWSNVSCGITSVDTRIIYTIQKRVTQNHDALSMKSVMVGMLLTQYIHRTYHSYIIEPKFIE